MSVVVRAVSVGRPAPLAVGGEEVLSGIVKRPTEGPVEARAEGLAGDGQADPRYHGGVHKAVYLYPVEHAAFWDAELGRALEPGGLGENLSIEGLVEADVRVGDRLCAAGGPELVVTGPRVPCAKLAALLASPRAGRAMLKSGFTGFYARVEVPGALEAGTTFEHLPAADGALTLHDVVGMVATSAASPGLLARIGASADLDPSWASWIERHAPSVASDDA